MKFHVLGCGPDHRAQVLPQPQRYRLGSARPVDATGTKLASATFTNTAASGWQTVTLATPVSIAANTTYVASYHTTGAYVATNNFFTTAVTSGVLTAPSTTTAGGNGVYSYGGTNTAGIFPTSTFSAANYYADVVFRPQLVG